MVLQGFVATRMGFPGYNRFGNPIWTRNYLVEYGYCENVDPSSPLYDHCVPAPLLTRYFVYLLNMATFNLGPSVHTGRPVLAELTLSDPTSGFFGVLGNTVALVSFATALSVVLGIILGSLASADTGRSWRKWLLAVPLGGSALPFFWVAIISWFLFVGGFRWFYPLFGSFPFWPGTSLLERVAFTFRVMLLPSMTLVLFTLGRQVVMMRDSVLRTRERLHHIALVKDGNDTKPQPSGEVLRSALIPVVRNTPTIFSLILGASFVTDVVFGWPGLGWFLVGRLGLDFPLIQGILYLSVLMVIAVWFFSRIAIWFLKPGETDIDAQVSNEGWSPRDQLSTIA